MYPSLAEQHQPWVHVDTMRCLLTLVKSRQALRASRSLVKFTTMTAPFVQRSGKRRSRIPCLGHSHAMAVAWLSMPCMAFTRAYSLFALSLMYQYLRMVTLQTEQGSTRSALLTNGTWCHSSDVKVTRGSQPRERMWIPEHARVQIFFAPVLELGVTVYMDGRMMRICPLSSN